MKDFPTQLLAGYKAFMDGRYASESKRYKALADAGQRPQVMVISCCDSRSAPETIFDAGPGEMFVVRNVANMVPPYGPDGQYHGTSAALEFAVQSLRVRDILVLGHGRCGGIQAALDSNFEPLSPGDFIGKWMLLLETCGRTDQCFRCPDPAGTPDCARAGVDPQFDRQSADVSLRIHSGRSRQAQDPRRLVRHFHRGIVGDEPGNRRFPTPCPVAKNRPQRPVLSCHIRTMLSETTLLANRFLPR